MVDMKCQNCGAGLTQYPGARFTICQYCKHQTVFDKEIERVKPVGLFVKTYSNMKWEKIQSAINQFIQQGWKVQKIERTRTAPKVPFNDWAGITTEVWFEGTGK